MEPKSEKLAGVALAVVIGVVLALVIVYGGRP
jgi:hypothetical protein